MLLIFYIGSYLMHFKRIWIHNLVWWNGNSWIEILYPITTFHNTWISYLYEKKHSCRCIKWWKRVTDEFNAITVYHIYKRFKGHKKVIWSFKDTLGIKMYSNDSKIFCFLLLSKNSSIKDMIQNWKSNFYIIWLIFEIW